MAFTHTKMIATHVVVPDSGTTTTRTTLMQQLGAGGMWGRNNSWRGDGTCAAASDPRNKRPGKYRSSSEEVGVTRKCLLCVCWWRDRNQEGLHTKETAENKNERPPLAQSTQRDLDRIVQASAASSSMPSASCVRLLLMASLTTRSSNRDRHTRRLAASMGAVAASTVAAAAARSAGSGRPCCRHCVVRKSALVAGVRAASTVRAGW